MINKFENQKSSEHILFRFLKRIYKMRIFNPLRRHIDKILVKVSRSIRFELLFVIGVCFVIASFSYLFLNGVLKHERSSSEITYNYKSIESSAKNFTSRIQNEASTTKNDDSGYYKKLFSGLKDGQKAYITDLDGNVTVKSDAVSETKVDIFSVMATTTNSQNDESGKAVRYIYPITIGEEKGYFIYEDTPVAQLSYTYYTETNSFLALFLSIIIFVVLFVSVTNSKMRYLDEIGIGLKEIAGGNLGYKIREEGSDEIKNIASNINFMSKEINKKIVAERRAEQTKSDLITNVSHDLRTPLTSIMGYIGLVKEGRYEDEATMKEYLDIAFSKAEKLKSLIEDLFEYTKLNNNGIKLNKSEVNISEFLFQLSEELTPLFEENQLTIIKSASEQKLMVNLDADKMLRVFENLLTNAVKYSYKPGSIIIGVYEKDGYVTVAIRNKGKNIPPDKVAKLFERFYRVDESRNASSGGSGLGLAISKNIVELHDGNIWAECYGEDISFYVRLKCSKII